MGRQTSGAANQFRLECERIFSPHGRSWKTACARALGIGRATLYRYFDNDDGIPRDVRQRLIRISAPDKPLIDCGDMIRLYARALVDLQRELDEPSYRSTDSPAGAYPQTLVRALDRAAALNAAAASALWPVEVADLLALAQKPLYEWEIDPSWDPHGDWTAARLVSNGAVTAECLELAALGQDPEAELQEEHGYERLRSICHDRSDGEEFYRAWRRMVILSPVIQDLRTTTRDHPVLEEITGQQLLAHFYRPVPAPLAHAGKLSLCKITRTILRPLSESGKAFETDSRDPRAIRLARMGQCETIDYTPGTRQLRRPFRIFWCLPGLTEIELERQLVRNGWRCELWPALDRIDLVASSPDGKQRLAIDVKDYISPGRLAQRFAGFKEFADEHHCVLVIPDYLPRISPDYQRRFSALRATWGKSEIKVRTVSGLLRELKP